MNHILIRELKEQFLCKRDAEVAIGQAAYMKNRFAFLGLKKPIRSSIQKIIFKKNTIEKAEVLIETTKELWGMQKREYHYAAMDLLEKNKKLWNSSFFSLFEYLVRRHSWWDSVDKIAASLLGAFLQKFPEYKPKMQNWILDENMWIRRSAILFQLKYKKQTEEKLLFDFCKKTVLEKEFFIRKAIGWVLREYSKTSPNSVLEFINQNREKLSPLSIKEASKYL